MAQAARFERELQLARVSWSFEISYNVAPTQSGPVVRAVNGEREGPVWRGCPVTTRTARPPSFGTSGISMPGSKVGRGTRVRCWDRIRQDVMVAYQVSTRADGRPVNSPKNNDERLIEPVRPGQ